MRRLTALPLLLLLAACGARSHLADGLDAGIERPLDAAADAARPDAGERDASADAGPIRPRCARDADCAEGVCRGSIGDPPRDLASIGLFCGAPEPDPSGAPGAPCRERASCDRHLCAIAGACVVPCASDADCDAAELCREVWVTTSPSAMERLTACTARVAAPESVRVAGPEPGPLLDVPAASDVLSDLRPGALVIWRGPAQSEPLIERVLSRTAAMEVLFDAFAPREADAPAPAWGIGAATVREVVTLLHPNGPRSPPPRLGFEVLLSATTPGPSERIVLQRMAPGDALDLDVYLAGGNGWTSRDGAPPPPLTEAVEALREVLAPAGLAIGEVRVHDVVGGLRRRFEMLTGSEGLLGAPPDLPVLYRLSAGARRPAVHVFLVRFIEGALGIASGIPGPHALPGTGASGVAIAADLVESPTHLGLVMAHEIGHFAGLFHTSEADGSVFDPLTDTPECRAENDLDGDGVLVPDECGPFGATNVMFWAGGGRAFSRQQAALLRGAYDVR